MDRLVRIGGTLYRQAGVKDLAQLIVGYLWEWIYRTGISKQQVLDFFRKFDPRKWLRGRRGDALPDDLIQQVARLMSHTGIQMGDLFVELEKALDTPPPGYRWKVDRFGTETLVKVQQQGKEHPIVKGKRFANQVFFGAWWVTGLPKGRANQALQRLCRSNNGGVFWNQKIVAGPRGIDTVPESEQTWNVQIPAGGRQYGAFCIVDQDNADEASGQLKKAADAMAQEGGGEYRLSAISLNGPAEHRAVKASDQVHTRYIKSIKFNWKYNLTDLLNGRIAEFKNAEPLAKLVQLIRESVS